MQDAAFAGNAPGPSVEALLRAPSVLMSPAQSVSPNVKVLRRRDWLCDCASMLLSVQKASSSSITYRRGGGGRGGLGCTVLSECMGQHTAHSTQHTAHSTQHTAHTFELISKGICAELPTCEHDHCIHEGRRCLGKHVLCIPSGHRTADNGQWEDTEREREREREREGKLKLVYLTMGRTDRK